MSHQEIRDRFIKFFESKGHKIIPSSSLLPTDPSVLFTTAGMQQFKPYYTDPDSAQKAFGSLNTSTIQKCLRTSDIDEVGDESHLTFFEMMGNFSFGGYWKKEAIEYAHEFIAKELGLEISSVSVFGGNDSVPRDDESANIWQSLDPKLKITNGDINDNFWGPTGSEGPCGPTTEIYVDGLEVWNIVLNEFYYPGSREELLGGAPGKTLRPLEAKGIDTGMGLERLVMVVQNRKNVYETDLFSNLISLLPDSLDLKTKRVIADHSRAVVFLLAEGVIPSNKEQGYILRRLMRRIITQEYLNQEVDLLKIINMVIKEYSDIYPELNSKSIIPAFEAEKSKFAKTLKQGLKELDKLTNIDAQNAFKLYESFGLPFEVIKEIGGEKATNLKRESFEEEFKRHQDLSRAGAESKFGGHGLVIKEGDLTASNQEEMAVKIKLHTATHLLQAGLRKVLGPEVKQEGSDISAERLRFDFRFPRKVTESELKEVGDWVNDVIIKDVEVKKEEMPFDEAIKSGALAFFKQKYPDRVSVYSIGDYSKELCGGPHVKKTGEIGKVKIVKEEAVSAGVRRLRAVIQ